MAKYQNNYFNPGVNWEDVILTEIPSESRTIKKGTPQEKEMWFYKVSHNGKEASWGLFDSQHEFATALNLRVGEVLAVKSEKWNLEIEIDGKIYTQKNGDERAAGPSGSGGNSGTVSGTGVTAGAPVVDSKTTYWDSFLFIKSLLGSTQAKELAELIGSQPTWADVHAMVTTVAISRRQNGDQVPVKEEEVMTEAPVEASADEEEVDDSLPF